MRIKIEFDNQTYYRTCSWAYRWTGVVKDAPDWLTDIILNEDAIVMKSNRDIVFVTVNGYPRAGVGDIIVKDGQIIDVIRRTT